MENLIKIDDLRVLRFLFIFSGTTRKDKLQEIIGFATNFPGVPGCFLPQPVHGCM